jgi:hypothetical protein
MPKKLSSKNRTIFICFIIILAFAVQSCGKTYYIFGALTKSNLYAYSPEGTYNNQGGVDWYPKLGVQIGVATNITDINKKFSLRTEVNASYQGARYEDITNSVTGSIDLLYTYLPLIVKYKRDSGIFGEAGFQPGLIISARDRIDGSATYFSDYVENLDFGITGGLGYEFNDKISIALMGYLGFINISEARTDAKNNTVVALRGTYTLKKHGLSKSDGK